MTTVLRPDPAARQDGEVDLTPLQTRAYDELFATGAGRPTFPPDTADRLRAGLEERLADLVETLTDVPFVVTKGSLSRVHTCEAHHVAEEAVGFSWSARTARGAIAHKAIELGFGMRVPAPPLELVDLAIDRVLEDERGPAGFLAEAPAAELGELRAAASDYVCKFSDEFPPLKAAWRPRLESSLIGSLFGGRIELRGKVDLALGQARGTAAHVLIVDFKTGRPGPAHIDDLRFYALLETLRVGVPPFRVASWYLDSGQWHAEDVDDDLLEVAVRRTADGVRKLATLASGRPPTLSPGPACRWCVARTTCDGAVAWAKEQDDEPE